MDKKVKFLIVDDIVRVDRMEVGAQSIFCFSLKNVRKCDYDMYRKYLEQHLVIFNSGDIYHTGVLAVDLPIALNTCQEKLAELDAVIATKNKVYVISITTSDNRYKYLITAKMLHKLYKPKFRFIQLQPLNSADDAITINLDAIIAFTIEEYQD